MPLVPSLSLRAAKVLYQPTNQPTSQQNLLKNKKQKEKKNIQRFITTSMNFCDFSPSLPYTTQRFILSPATKFARKSLPLQTSYLLFHPHPPPNLSPKLHSYLIWLTALLVPIDTKSSLWAPSDPLKSLKACPKVWAWCRTNTKEGHIGVLSASFQSDGRLPCVQKKTRAEWVQLTDSYNKNIVPWLPPTCFMLVVLISSEWQGHV